MRTALAVVSVSLAGCVHADVVPDGAEPRRVAEGFEFTEGPAADKAGSVYFSDQPTNRIYKWSAEGGITIFMEDSGRSNGLFVDNDGYLIACADEDNQLWRISMNGEVETLVDSYENKRLNGPNDVWVAADGGLYFTDPYYQRDWWTRKGPELESRNVFHLAADGTLRVVDDDFVRPNGIIGSRDGKRLYVADIGAGKTYVYDRLPDGSLAGRSTFVSRGSDGMTIDDRGNLYLTGDGIAVFDQDGRKVTHIDVDATRTTNVTFAGAAHDLLFITAPEAVFTLQMSVKGARW